LDARAPPWHPQEIGAKLTGEVVDAPQAERAPPGKARIHFWGNWRELDGVSG